MNTVKERDTMVAFFNTNYQLYGD